MPEGSTIKSYKDLDECEKISKMLRSMIRSLEART
jgi:hypothetical protein